MHSVNIVKAYLYKLFRELISPVNYLLALGIGLVIQLLQGNPVFSSPVPYAVPVLVQAFSKSFLRFRARHNDLLLSLPGRRTDPAFVVDREGNIITSSGSTRELFEKRGILTLEKLLGRELSEKVFSEADTAGKEAFPLHFETYCVPLGKWYRISVSREDSCRVLLVWMDDIAAQKRIYRNLFSMHGFTDSLFNDLYRVAEHDTTFSRLASIILDFGYGAVLIAKVPETDSEILVGNVYVKRDGTMVTSPEIRISRASDAPVWRSRKSGEVTWDQVKTEHEVEAFARRYPFDREVLSRIGSPVRNFINFHEGQISLIAFNLDHEILAEDLLAVDIVVNTARSVSGLITLAQMNENKFFQGVTGLCAAAEYSDEITGLHIYRVNEYSRFLAGELGMGGREQEWIGKVAAMHDIGKVAIPHLIKLPRPFTPEEREQMQMHAVYGAQIIDRMMNCCSDRAPRLFMAREIALNHHQFWDGSGYPGVYDDEGRQAALESREPSYYRAFRPGRGEEIPLAARIVALADSYDALRSPRQYKQPMSHSRAMELLRLDDRTGTAGAMRFGPDVMAAFEEQHLKFAEIYDSMTDPGQVY
jgi:HD-GYP domain-containing protein (c-di-GMP phosphodiesterase class II)